MLQFEELRSKVAVDILRWPATGVVVQVLRQQLDMLQHQVSQLSMHRQHWHQQQQEQAAIAASAQDAQQDAQLAGPSTSTGTDGQSSSSQPTDAQPADSPAPAGD